ncbi:hypothetical protein BDZ91DRAFT_759787 [Kalaharituber pfeilii]|nr:hypothetical protein BDZ91DRAFT_759787 [Kalaharituber pfeilii]
MSQLVSKAFSRNVDPALPKNEAEPQGVIWHEILVPRKREFPYTTLSPSTLAPQALKKMLTIVFMVTIGKASAYSDVIRGHSENALNDEAAVQLLHDETIASCPFRMMSKRTRINLSSPLTFPPLLPEDFLNLYETTRTSFALSISSEGDTSQSHPPSSLPLLPPLPSSTNLEDPPAPQQLFRVQSLNANNPFDKPKPISTIVGVIAISQLVPEVQNTELIELTIGDEAALGVRVTSWLDSPSPELWEKLIGECAVVLKANAGQRRLHLGQRSMVVNQQTEKGLLPEGLTLGDSREDGDRTMLSEGTQVENGE